MGCDIHSFAEVREGGASEERGLIVALDVHSWEAWDALMAEGVFARHPVREVRCHCARPTLWHRHGDRDRWLRWHEVGPGSPGDSTPLPAGVFRMLPGDSFGSLSAAMDALHLAMLDAGRDAADLPALEVHSTPREAAR